MPIKTDIKLDIVTKNYTLVDNRIITVCDVKSPDDPGFYLQLRFLNKNNINSSEIKEQLIALIKKSSFTKKIFLNKKLEYLKCFSNVDFELKSSQALFKLDARKQNLINVFDKNLIDLFVLDTLTKGNKIYYLSYEIPKDITENSAPLCSISIYADGKLSEKIYLFPTHSLKNIITTLKNNENINQDNLDIPYVRNIDPYNQNKSHNQEIQTRINLQTIISEILIHLEKPKCFRKNGSKKMDIFRNLAKSIANGETLDTISNYLNAHDSWKLLAQHRDPWGFLSFFKGKTHSLIAWKALKEIISESNKTTVPSLSL